MTAAMRCDVGRQCVWIAPLFLCVHSCSCSLFSLCVHVPLLFVFQVRSCASGRARWSVRRRPACAPSTTPTCRRTSDEPSCTSYTSNRWRMAQTTRRLRSDSLRQLIRTARRKRGVEQSSAVHRSIRSVCTFPSDVSCCFCFLFCVCSVSLCSALSRAVLTLPASATCPPSCARRAMAVWRRCCCTRRRRLCRACCSWRGATLRAGRSSPSRTMDRTVQNIPCNCTPCPTSTSTHRQPQPSLLPLLSQLLRARIRALSLISRTRN